MNIKVLLCKLLLTVFVPLIILWFLPKAIYNMLFNGLKVDVYFAYMLSTYLGGLSRCDDLNEEKELGD